MEPFLSRAFAPQTCILRARMSASTLDTVLTTYLSLHAVLALLIDAQSVLPDLAPSVLAAYQRAGLTQPVARWVADEGDFLVGSNPLWFRWIVGGEVLFQLPVCIALAFGFAKRRQWVRLPSLNPAYGMARTSSPMSKPRPLWPTRAAQAADWPRLAKARGSLRHGLALRAASGEPAGRRRSQLVFDTGPHDHGSHHGCPLLRPEAEPHVQARLRHMGAP